MFGLVSERVFRGGAEGQMRGSGGGEREVMMTDEGLREQRRGEEVGLRGEVQGRLRGLSGGGVQVLGA